MQGQADSGNGGRKMAALQTTGEKRPLHPGSYVRQAMEGLGLSINAFARTLGVTPATAHRLVTEKSALSPVMAVRLSMTVGHTAEHWLGYQFDYDLYLARRRLDASRFSVLKGINIPRGKEEPILTA